MNSKELIARCIEYRAMHDLNQEEMAKRCGVHILTIHNLEQGRPLRRTTVAKIMMVLNADRRKTNDGEGIQE